MRQSITREDALHWLRRCEAIASDRVARGVATMDEAKAALARAVRHLQHTPGVVGASDKTLQVLVGLWLVDVRTGRGVA